MTKAGENHPLPRDGGGENNGGGWLYGEEHCRGIETALRRGRPGEIYNIAGGNVRRNIVLTHKVLELTGKSRELIQLVKDRPGHDRRYSIDAAKLRALGWAPRMNWDAGTALTVKWYRDNEWWWRKIKTGEFLEYYRKQYQER